MMRILLTAVVLSVPTLAYGQRAPFPIPDPDPEIERRSFIVADGFEVNLFAADPLIAKPIQMNFDPAGRLWIASSEVYPQIKPGQVANDKVLVVEDRDGDGRADKTTVFAGGLLIPTGVEPGDGGAYVANSTELLHLKDTDGDGKADQTRVVLSGFGTEDTHHILHTLRWGYDGMLYFNQSVYIHSHIETPHGVRRLGGGGIWQFRPETMRLEVFIRGLVNPWGHHFDRWGQSFATDGAGGEGINYCIPGAYYVWAVDAVRILPGLNPGSPKYCGLEVVSGRHMPESWQGNLLTNDFRGNRVCRFVVSDDGAGLRRARAARADQDEAHGLPADRHQDGAGRRDLHRRLVQPDHPARRGRLPRPAARPHPRPDLAGHGQGAAAGASAEAGRRRHADAARRPEVAGAVDPAAGAAGAPGAGRCRDRRRVARPGSPRSTAAIPRPSIIASRRSGRSRPSAAPSPCCCVELLHSPDARVRAAAVRVVPQWRDRLDHPVALLGERVGRRASARPARGRARAGRVPGPSLGRKAHSPRWTGRSTGSSIMDSG